MTTGEKIQFFMKQKGVSGRWLAEQIGRKPNWVYRVTGNRTKCDLEMLKKIAEVLGIPVINLL